MRARLLSALAVTCLAVAPLAAQPVEPGEEAQLARLLPAEPGARICFAREYDDAHLSQHPKQKVRSMGFRLAYFAHEPDEYYPMGQRNYYFELSAVLRGDDRKVEAAGECVPAPDGRNISCGVDCDGGGVLIREAAGGGILVDLGSTGRIRMSEGCDDESGFDLEPGADDSVFMLTEVPSCPAYDDW